MIRMKLEQAEYDMRFSQGAIQLACLQGKLARFGKGLAGRIVAINREVSITDRQARVSERVIWIATHSLLEIVDSFSRVLWGALVCVKATLQVKLVGLGVLRVVLR